MKGEDWRGKPESAKPSPIIISRRRLLTAAGLGGLGAITGGGLLAACAQPSGSGASPTAGGASPINTPPPGADTLTGDLHFLSVNYNQPKVESYLEAFRKAYPNVKVAYETVASDLIHEKQVSIFAGSGAVPDLMYVDDSDYRAFIEAGWLQPLDDFEGASEAKADFYKHTESALVWDGKLYGLPYYSSMFIFAYSQVVFDKVGIDSPPNNLMELEQQALEIRRAGVVDYPILMSLKKGQSGDFSFWSLLFASGGRMFDADMKPEFAQDGSAAEQVIAWLARAVNETQILNPASVETSVDDPFAVIGSANTAFAGIMDLFLFYANTGEVTNPGTTKLMPYPGLASVNQGTMGWTRAYSIPEKATNPLASWHLAQYVGGAPLAGESKGEYFAARSWFVTDALGYGYAKLEDDPEIIAEGKKWVDVDLMREQRRSTRARENILVPWYYEWSDHLQTQVQEAIAKRKTPREAVQELAKRTEELTTKFGL